MLPKTIWYSNSFDETKYTYFLTKEKKLLKAPSRYWIKLQSNAKRI